MPRWNVRTQEGFTLIEMMLVVCVIGILGAMATFQIGAARPGLQGDGAMRAVMAELNLARETAVAQRRPIQLAFVGTNRLQIVRMDSSTTTTTLTDVAFESGMQYGVVSGIVDTPDAFGNGTATSFGNATGVRFNTEGSLVDTGGSPVNGTIFLAIPNVTLSFRAVTVQGSTGRVRGWRWNGQVWTRV